MSTSITHEDVKPRVGIPSATTTFDTEIDTICTAMGAAVDAYVASVYLTSDAAVVKEAAILISSGTLILSMAKRPGWGEAVTAGGLALGALGDSGGADLVKLGWELLKPFTDSGNAEELAKQAEAVRQKLLSEARDDDCAAQADAELLKLQNEAAKLGSEKLKIDSEELKTDAETALLTAQELKTDAETAKLSSEKLKIDSEELKTDAETALLTAQELKTDAETAKFTAEELGVDAATALTTAKATTEASVKLKTDAEKLKVVAETDLVTAEVATEANKPAKVLADAAFSTGLGADAQARANVNLARLIRMNAEDAAIADVTDVPSGSTDSSDCQFDFYSQEYNL